MRELFLVMGIPMALAACGMSTIAHAPSVIAEQTTLDEQGALGVELAYKAFRTALEVAVDAGLLRGERATQAAALDDRAYTAVAAARAAYRAGNAASYAQAVTDARAAITAALAAIGSK